jgi:hypothetical protein
MEIVGKNEKFALRLEFSYLGQEGRDPQSSLDEYIQQRLDSYMEYRMPDLVEDSVEGRFTTRVFGPAGRGRYSRLTIRQPGRGAHSFVTHGARIADNTIVIFTLHSSDSDERILVQTLDAVSSVAANTEIASFVGSYSCRSEHRVGFRGRNAVWIPDIADVVDQRFTVRTSSKGDQFDDTSSWVFVESGRMRATSWCEEEAVERGVFVCHGANDEEFRMDTSTLRFLYTQMAGYYDVADGVVLGRNQATPFMDIGVCERTER